MSQTFVITTPDTVDTSKRVFPQAGVINLKVIKNGDYRKTGIWINGTTVIASHPLKIVGGKFTGFVSSGVTHNVVPSSVPVIDATTVTLANSVFNYLEITIDEGKPFAYITTDYFVGDVCISGGTEDTSALIDYSVRPYFAASLNGMFNNRKVRYDLTRWNTNPVLNMNLTFANTTTFNQDIGNWDVSNVTDFTDAFRNAKSFNKPLANWNMIKATTISGIFRGASVFDQELGSWNLSSCTSFASTFRDSIFNKSLSNWNVSKGTEFGGMFWNNTKFNQAVSNWNISTALNMSSMFNGATSFNQDLSAWCAKFNINVNLANFLDNSGVSATNYSAFLNALWTDVGTTRQSAWVARTTAKILGAANLKYNSTAAAARASLIANGWTITDGGLAV